MQALATVLYGLTTGNSSYPLKDHAELFLTTSIFVDRSKKIYGGQIAPDIFTDNPIEKAIVWIMEQ